MPEKIRVRFAPSPTGYLHVGGLRSALYDYLFAKKNYGDFILKIEDTDKNRFIEGAAENLVDVLDWIGLEYNEGVFAKSKYQGPNDKQIPKSKIINSKNYNKLVEVGKYGPYIQSEKLEVYKKYAEQLVKDGHAYYCFCEPQRLEDAKKIQMAEKKPAMYDKYCLYNLTPEQVNKNLKDNCPYTIRLKIPQNETIEFEDIVRGKIKFNTNVVDDQILIKSDGYPTYHLANVVDDHDMQISHVIRGEEWLSSVPKHILLYRYLGWEMPKFAHLPLILNPDKTKLSKRQGDVAVEDYIQKGYLKEAILNFVALLGWNPGKGETQEIFSLDELVQKFELEKVHKAGAVFDIKKLDWINSQLIKKLSLDDLYQRSLEFWKQKDFYNNALEEKKSEEYIKKVLTIERDRLAKLSEVGESTKFFFKEINYEKNLLHWKEMSDDDLKLSLKRSKDILNDVNESNWSKSNLERTLMEAAGDKKGELLWPLRVALTGEKKSPPPQEVAWVLGKQETLNRINQAINKVV